MLKIVGTDGNQYFAWNLIPGTHVFGRNKHGDYCIPNRTVSRQHAEIRVSPEGDRHILCDLGSHNGTLHNGQLIDSEVEIKAGDSITFGQVEFRVTDGDPASSGGPRVSTTQLAQYEPEKSVLLDINEALKPLPSNITEKPDVLPTLFEMAKMLVLPEPREIMLQRSLVLVAKVIPSQRFAVLFTSEDGDEVYTAATLLPEGKDPGQFNMSRTIVNQILSDKQSILIGDPRENPNFAQQHSIIMSEINSAMAVPLIDEDKVYGILYVDTTNPGHRYTNDHLRLLATFGNIIGARMLNYALLEERQEKQVIEAELARASAIQKYLLQKSLPDTENYNIHSCQEQCRAVGGDMYDVAYLPDGRLLFLVADVSGKGMGAALLMSNILASFRILYDQKDFDLLRAIRQVSRQLCLFSTPADFATLFAGLLDPRNHTVAFVNAGHNPPILIKSDGATEHLEASGIMVGAMPDADWRQETVTLSKGDTLTIFTDGVTEAEAADESLFGEERLERFLISARDRKAVEICHDLMDEIRDFVQDAPQSDDITLLVLQREK